MALCTLLLLANLDSPIGLQSHLSLPINKHEGGRKELDKSFCSIVNLHYTSSSQKINHIPITFGMVRDKSALITVWSWQIQRGFAAQNSFKTEVVLRCDLIECDEGIAATIKEIFEAAKGPDATLAVMVGLEGIASDRIRRLPCGFQLRLSRESESIPVTDLSRMAKVDSARRDFSLALAAIEKSCLDGRRASVDEKTSLIHLYWEYEMRKQLLEKLSLTSPDVLPHR